jgi:hypothetical protein
MKLNKQIIKKINSTKMFLIFILLVILSLMVIHFVFRFIRLIFDMDKTEETRLKNAKLSADGKANTNSNYK